MKLKTQINHNSILEMMSISTEKWPKNMNSHMKKSKQLHVRAEMVNFTSN